MNKKIIINKFGGAIMGTADLILRAQEQVSDQHKAGNRPIVVVSALKGVTDELVSILYNLKQQLKDNGHRAYPGELIQLFIKDLKERHFSLMKEVCMNEREAEALTLKLNALFAELESDLAVISRFGLMAVVHDKVLAYGEKLASWFFAHLLESSGMRARRLSGEELGILTDSAFLDANIMFDESAKNAVKSLESAHEGIPVITGFIGKNADGQTTTLGRGGSDTTACFLGAALHAHKVILWKEVNGVLSADPNIVSHTRTIPYISYEEAEESGKVICDKAIQYLKMFETPGEVVSLTDPAKGTHIGPKNDSEKGVKIISAKKDLAHIVITDEKVKEYGFLYQISKVFTNHRVNMVIIRNTRDRLYIVVENGGHERVKASLEEMKELGYHIATTPVAMVTVIGNLEWKDVNIFNDTLSALSKDAPLGAFPYRNCTRLEAVVKNEELEAVIKGFHDVFIQREI